MKQDFNPDKAATNPGTGDTAWDRLTYLGAMLAGLTLPALTGCEPEKPAVPEKGSLVSSKDEKFAAEAIISRDLIETHVTFLAKDEHLGRDTGKGQLEGPVTEYVEKIWKDLGLKPAGNKEGTSFRQAFSVRTWDDTKKDRGAGSHAHIGREPNEFGLAFPPDAAITSFADLKAARPLSNTALKTHNLIGIIEGSHPELKREYVAIGAHLDHVGVRSDKKGEDNIFNGADDNASGSAAILSISKALATAKKEGRGPDRSVVIILFSGEELGLLGSQYFVDYPTVDISKVRGMINLDMIGRLDPKQVSIFDKSPDGANNYFHRHHDTSGTRIERIDHNVNSLVARSDQYAFYRKGIPVMFFFEGFTPDGEMNPDYHGVSDHADRIDFDKVRDIARLAYRHLLSAANRKE
jgi:hypothetical protein